jgi:hypothetical protein
MWKIASMVVVASAALLSACGSDEVRAYDECAIGSIDQCEPGTGCFTISLEGIAAGLCTDFCSSSLDCPLDARGFAGECISFAGGDFTCFESCIDSSDCAAGWACRTSAGADSFPPICLPD